MNLADITEPLTKGDYDQGADILGGRWRHPDLIIAPAGEPVLYRWHLYRNRTAASIYFHLQVRSDPERPLHDHPWDNTSVILSGGYNEMFEPHPELVPASYYPRWEPNYRTARKGKVIHRKATTAHRLILPDDIPYTMSLFTTGPVKREWGFWYPDGFHSHKRHVADRDGMSVHENRGS